MGQIINEENPFTIPEHRSHDFLGQNNGFEFFADGEACFSKNLERRGSPQDYTHKSAAGGIQNRDTPFNTALQQEFSTD